MTAYEQRFIKMLTYDYPDEIPVSCWVVPAAWLRRFDDMKRLAAEFPEYIPHVPDLSKPETFMPQTYRVGKHVDAWGCIWSNVEEGLEALVTGHPVPSREDIRALEIPTEIDGIFRHGFMYLRLLDLRGFEESMLDFADECEELQILIDKVVEYNLRQAEAALPRYAKGELVTFGDDLGMQNALAIGAEKWRKYLKPAFTKIFEPFKRKGCYVYMHTDGWILDIINDLHECGADVINPQSGANGLDNIARICRGRIPIDIDLDRQLTPFATPSQIDDHVRECVETLSIPSGGLGLKTDINFDVPTDNIAALLEACRKYSKIKK